MLYGRDSVSLSTSKEVSRAGELARWIVMDSGVSAKLAAGSAAFAMDFMPCVLGLTAGSSGNHRVTNQSEATLCRSAACCSPSCSCLDPTHVFSLSAAAPCHP